MTTFGDIIEGAKFRADLVNADRVTLVEWCNLANEAVTSAWMKAALARPDFQVQSADFALVSGGSASLTVPSNFLDLIDVVYAPDTSNEYSLGPFAWQNRRSPGGWLAALPGLALGGSRARLMGSTVYIEPAQQAAGSYRVWYCPKPKTIKFVAYATTVALPACVSLGAGPSHTLAALANGALSVDGAAVAANDRVLVKNQVALNDNGIYTVSAPGSAGTPFILARADDYDESVEIVVGDSIFITGGATQANLFASCASFTGGVVETSQIGFALKGTAGGPIDSILESFTELLKITAGLPAADRDDDLPIARMERRQLELEGQLAAYFSAARTSNAPTKPIDTDARGVSPWWGGWG